MRVAAVWVGGGGGGDAGAQPLSCQSHLLCPEPPRPALPPAPCLTPRLRAAPPSPPPPQRLVITNLLINAFRTVLATTPADLLPMIYLCTNRVAPAHPGVELGIGDAILIKVCSGVLMGGVSGCCVCAGWVCGCGGCWLARACCRPPLPPPRPRTCRLSHLRCLCLAVVLR